MLVYLPEKKFDSLDGLHRSSVGDLFSDLQTADQLSIVPTKKGPDGGCGTFVMTWQQSQESPLLSQDRDWQKGSDGNWYAWDAGPTPESLERIKSAATQFETVFLADGSLWEVPVLREPVVGGRVALSALHYSHLPCSCFPNSSGDWQVSVLPKYVDLFERSRFWFDVSMGLSAETRFSLIEVFRYACDVLSLRYRYTVPVHSVLREKFLTTENVWEVINASCGYTQAARYLQAKKKIDT